MALYGCEKKPHSRVRQLPAGFPKPHWLLSFYLADCSCPASHKKDRICGPLHWLLCLLPHTWWEAPTATTDSHCVPPTLLWLWTDCYDILVTNNTYFSPPHTSASGTTDMKKFVFYSMQNWSSRLKFEWTIQNTAASFPTQKPVILSEKQPCSQALTTKTQCALFHLEKRKKASPNRKTESDQSDDGGDRFVDMYTGKLCSCQENTFPQSWWTFVHCVRKYCTAVLKQESKPNTSITDKRFL